MPKFRKLPVVIEAKQWTGTFTSADQVIAWAIGRGVGPGMRYVRLGNTIDIPTKEGVMSASAGDWIIKGVAGEFYPCKPDIFEATYEAVRDE
jgi:hypothetical protein